LAKLYDEAQAYPDGKFLTIGIASPEDRQEFEKLLTMKRLPPASA
jgi:hypothetical protein